MKITKCLDVLVVLLAVVLCWSLVAPARISAEKPDSLVGGCRCNWNAVLFCPTSKDAPSGKTCIYGYKEYRGDGNNTPTSQTYCTGIQYCDQKTSWVCPVG